MLETGGVFEVAEDRDAVGGVGECAAGQPKACHGRREAVSGEAIHPVSPSMPAQFDCFSEAPPASKASALALSIHQLLKPKPYFGTVFGLLNLFQ